MGKRTALVLLGLLIIAAGIASCIAALSTVHWQTSHDVDFGLFEACKGGVCYSYSEIAKHIHYDIGKEKDFVRTKAGLICGVILAIFAVVMGVFYLSARKNSLSTRCMFFGSIVFGISAGVSVLIGVIVFSSSDVIDEDGVEYGYSFGLSILSCLLMIGGGVVMIPGWGGKTTPGLSVSTVQAPPQHNVAAMENSSVYGYDQEETSPSPPSYAESENYHQFFWKNQANARDQDNKV